MSSKDLEAAGVIPGKHKHPMPKVKSFEGMPGYVKTGQNKDGESIVRGHSSVGPKREGPIGERGHGSTAKKVYSSRGGQMTHSYKSDSTGKPGHYHMSAEGARKDIPGDRQKIGGHPGRMEKLSGHAKTHAEGRRKTKMY